MSRDAAPNKYLARIERGKRQELITPEGIPIYLTLADAGHRATAFLLDFCLIAVIMIVLSLITQGAWAGAIFMILRSVYFAGFEVRWQGSTPGKRAMGIRVVGSRGGPLTADAIIARNLVRELEVFVPLGVLFVPEQLAPDAPGWIVLLSIVWVFIFALMPLFNRHRLRVGDMIAGTMVVLAPKALLDSDLVGAEVQRASKAPNTFTFSKSQLDIYGIYELQVLEKLLRSDHSMDRPVTVASVCDRIKTKIAWSRDNWHVDAERFLREFYAALRAHLEHKMLLGKRRESKFDTLA